MIALVMQTVDNSITTYSKRSRLTGRWHLSSKQGHGAPNPTWIPVANQAVRKMAEILGGKPGGVWWLSPLGLIGLIALPTTWLSLAIADERYRALWKTPKSIDLEWTLWFTLGLLLFLVGALLP